LRAIAPGYRLHRSDVPGKPDIVYVGRRRAIFVHGCFWHGHDCARGARMPKANASYWSAKIERNRVRDRMVRERLEQAGWRSLVVWECEMRDEAALKDRLAGFIAT
jgi:DNA mismatch endonuclease (patch repair protein)